MRFRISKQNVYRLIVLTIILLCLYSYYRFNLVPEFDYVLTIEKNDSLTIDSTYITMTYPYLWSKNVQAESSAKDYIRLGFRHIIKGNKLTDSDPQNYWARNKIFIDSVLGFLKHSVYLKCNVDTRTQEKTEYTIENVGASLYWRENIKTDSYQCIQSTNCFFFQKVPLGYYEHQVFSENFGYSHKLGVFTAWNVCRHCLTLKLNDENPKNTSLVFALDFQAPTNFITITPEPDKRTFSKIEYNTKEKISEIRKNGISMVIEVIPNTGLQDMRNFFLTTILGLLMVELIIKKIVKI